jgi:biopolymer transport protein TolR
MGMGAGGAAAGGGGRRRRGVKHAPMAEINMTPFIDVMLVLLIIFMVAAPLLAVGVPIDLPKTAAGPINVDQKPLTVSIDEKGKIYMQDAEVPLGDLVNRLKTAAKQGFDERIYVRGANKVDYGRVAEVLALIKSAGFTKTALVNQPADGKK